MKNKITATIDHDENADCSPHLKAWKATLHYNQSSLETTILGFALDLAPEVRGVVYHVQTAAKFGLENLDEFMADWKIDPASEYGTKVAKDHEEAVAFVAEVKRLFGDEFDEFVNLSTTARLGLTEPHFATEYDNTTIITRNGQRVECYGEWREDSNAACVFDDESLDGVYADGAKSWTEVVEVMTEYAKRNGTTLVEASAC